MGRKCNRDSTEHNIQEPTKGDTSCLIENDTSLRSVSFICEATRICNEAEIDKTRLARVHSEAVPKSRLQEIRREIFSHAVWHFTGEKLLALVERNLLGAIMGIIIGLLTAVWTATRESIYNLPAPARLIIAFGAFLIVFIVVCAIGAKLRRRTVQEKKARFGVYWDESLEPYCPVCGLLLRGEEWAMTLRCTKCETSIPLIGDDGTPMTLLMAREYLRKEQQGESERKRQ
jgi:hypothetical protein